MGEKTGREEGAGAVKRNFLTLQLNIKGSGCEKEILECGFFFVIRERTKQKIGLAKMFTSKMLKKIIARNNLY